MAKHKQKTQVTGAIELFGKSYDAVMKNVKAFAVLLALPFAASVISTLSDTNKDATFIEKTGGFSGLSLAGYSIVGLVGVTTILVIAGFVVALVLQAMIYGLQLEAAKGATPNLKTLFNLGKKYWLKLFGVMLLIGFYIAVPVMLVAGVFFLLTTAIGSSYFTAIVSIAMVIVVIVFVLQHYFLAPYALIDKDLSVFDALQESSRISKGYASSIWSIIGVSILLSATGALPVLGPLLSFALSALYSVAPAIRYQELKQIQK